MLNIDTALATPSHSEPVSSATGEESVWYEWQKRGHAHINGKPFSILRNIAGVKNARQLICQKWTN